MATVVTPVIDGINEAEQARLRELAGAIREEPSLVSEQWGDDADWLDSIADRARFWNREQVAAKNLRAGDRVQVYNRDSGDLEIKTVKNAGRWGDKSTRVQFEDGEGLLFGRDATVHRIKEES